MGLTLILCAVAACSTDLVSSKQHYIYAEGYKAEGRYRKALVHYEKAAEQGYAEAQMVLSIYHRSGHLIDEDGIRVHNIDWRDAPEKSQEQWQYWTDKAISSFREASEAGDAEAQFQLAGLLYAGARLLYPGGPMKSGDYVRVKKERESALAKEQEEAFKWWEAAALQGHAKAQLMIGHFKYWVNGKCDEALPWIQKSAYQGEVWAMEKLALAYHKGCGVEPDLEAYLAWVRQAAEAGDARAQHELAYAEQDWERYMEWLEKAPVFDEYERLGPRELLIFDKGLFNSVQKLRKRAQHPDESYAWEAKRQLRTYAYNGWIDEVPE